MLPWKNKTCSNLSYPACKAHAPYYIAKCGLSGCTVFFTLCHKQHDFRKKKLRSIKCAFWFSVLRLFETFLIIRRLRRELIINAHRSWRETFVILVRSYWNSNFHDIFSKNTQISNFMKIRPVWVELFDAEGWTNGQT